MNKTDKAIKKILDEAKTYKDFKNKVNEIFFDPIVRVVKGWGKETEIVVKYEIRNTSGYIFADVWLEEVLG